MTAVMYIGDAIQVMDALPEKSVDLIISSPPFLALRSYLPNDHPDKALEGGSQSTPGEFIDWLLDVVEACARVLAPHGSLVFELGDTYSGSGGAGGDYAENGLRDGQPFFEGSDSRGRGRRNDAGFRSPGIQWQGWPLAKSLSLIPESFRWAMVYGHNPHTGRTCDTWRLRNVIRWVRPNPPVGALGDKFRPATSELMVFCKAKDRFFDLDAVREPAAPASVFTAQYRNERKADMKAGVITEGEHRFTERLPSNPAGAPPLDWWNISRDEEAQYDFFALNPHFEPGWKPETPPTEARNIPLLEGEEETRYGPKPPEPTAGGPYRPGRKPVPDRNPSHGWGDTPQGRENPNGPPPLDWWNIPPGGYPGSHYAVWPPELLIKPIKAMTPERVCRTCGEPSRRIVVTRPDLTGQRSLADEIVSRRIQAGVGRAEMVAWFPHYKNGESVMAQVSNWELAKNVPSPSDWEILKERLGVSDIFDELVNGDRRWTESTVEYLADGKTLAVDERRTGGIGYDRGGGPPAVANRIKANRKAPDAWTDCLHDDWRPGLVLDPFGGSGTTALVATGHGRDCILIDLDERNYDLALERVGPFILTLAETPTD